MVTSTNFRGLVNQRFVSNLFPVPPNNGLQVGSMAPSFQLFNVSSGQHVELSDYAGGTEPDKAVWNRPVVLAFTRIFTEKQYCPLCYPHIVELNQAYETFVAQGAEVLMITSTDTRQSKIVLQDLGLKMPLLSDPTCRIFRKYRTGQALGAPLPAQFILDRFARIRFRHLFSFLEPNASVERLLAALNSIPQ